MLLKSYFAYNCNATRNANWGSAEYVSHNTGSLAIYSVIKMTTSSATRNATKNIS